MNGTREDLQKFLDRGQSHGYLTKDFRRSSRGGRKANSRAALIIASLPCLCTSECPALVYATRPILPPGEWRREGRELSEKECIVISARRTKGGGT